MTVLAAILITAAVTVAAGGLRFRHIPEVRQLFGVDEIRAELRRGGQR